MLVSFMDSNCEHSMGCIFGGEKRQLQSTLDRAEQVTLTQDGMKIFYRTAEGLLKKESCRIPSDSSLVDMGLLRNVKAVRSNDYSGKLYAHKWSRQIESICIEGGVRAEILAQLDRFPVLRSLSLKSRYIHLKPPEPITLSESVKERLEYLDIDGLGDWEPLRGCIALTELVTDGQCGLDLADMPTLQGVKRFTIKRYQWPTLEGIGNLPNVEWVNLTDSKIGDITALSELEHLTDIGLQGNYIHDLSPLMGSNIKVLDISSNLVEDLSPLNGLPLVYLEIDHNPVESLEPLAGMVDMELLHLTDTYVKDISPLFGMKRLKELTLDVEKLTDKKQLRQLSHVDRINGMQWQRLCACYHLDN